MSALEKEPYRALAIVEPYPALDTVKPWSLGDVGPRLACPACGFKGNSESSYATVVRVRACRGTVRPSPWWRFWNRSLVIGKCSRVKLHIHQNCHRCKAEWICAPFEDA